jgi:hypothetical protein
MGLELAALPYRAGGVQAALAHLAATAPANRPKAERKAA